MLLFWRVGSLPGAESARECSWKAPRRRPRCSSVVRQAQRGWTISLFRAKRFGLLVFKVYANHGRASLLVVHGIVAPSEWDPLSWRFRARRIGGMWHWPSASIGSVRWEADSLSVEKPRLDLRVRALTDRLTGYPARSIDQMADGSNKRSIGRPATASSSPRPLCEIHKFLTCTSCHVDWNSVSKKLTLVSPKCQGSQGSRVHTLLHAQEISVVDIK